MRIVAGMLFVLWALLPVQGHASQWVSLPYAIPGGASGSVEAVVRRPAADANGQALLVLHHGGGFGAGTTTQYAQLFSAKGFTTLELRMFDAAGRAPSPATLYAMMASALDYLARQPSVRADRISAMGMSLGAFMTISATSRWFYAHHRLGELRFHRLAALYPVCWMMHEAAQGRTDGLRPFAGLPSDFLQSYARVPLLILAGGKDDYDGANPSACPDFVRQLPDEAQAQITEVKVYPEATHGWDHGRTYEFMVYNGCAVRSSCRNYNVFTPETVEKGKQDLLMFFTRP